MANEKDSDKEKRMQQLSRQIGAKEARKLKAQKNNIQTIWYGLSLIGLIGWSITLPTLFGVILGQILDNRFPGMWSWTIILLFSGLSFGCVNAWWWLLKEDRKIREEHDRKDE